MMNGVNDENANAYQEGLGAKWAGIGPIRKNILKYSMRSCRSQRPSSVTRSAPRIPNVIIRTPGLTSTLTFCDLANARSRPICCTTTGRMRLSTLYPPNQNRSPQCPK